MSKKGRELPGTGDAFRNALALHQQGNLAQAELAYRAILKHAPRHFDALHYLGVVEYQRKHYEAAIELIGRALKLNPGSAPAHSNLGLAFYGLERHAEALASFDLALALKPDHREALNNRGNALRALERHTEALASYEQALELKPDYYEALNNRGNALRSLKRHEEALASYERARELRPNAAEAHVNIGNTLKEMGRVAEAREHLERALALAPRRGEFYLDLAECKKFVAGDPHLKALESLARTMKALPDSERMQVHFALGKAYEDVGRHEAAFEHLREGNALKRRTIAYDEGMALAAMRRTVEIFTPQLLGERRGSGDPSRVPVFVLGMPRSGTTLVEQILASHPAVYGAGELEVFNDAITHLACGAAAAEPYPELVPGFSGEQFRQLGRHYIAAVTALAPQAQRVTDKMPSNFRFAGLIHLALPNARIIHVWRDPVDTCLSCFSTLFAAPQPFAYDLGELGRFYRAYAALMAHWRQILPPGVMVEVRYEDVVGDLEAEARRIVTHCGLAWDDACLAFHENRRLVRTASMTQVRQPIYRGSVGRGRSYGDKLEPLLIALRGE